MIIKVCGLTQEKQVLQLDELDSVAWLGSIFYAKSKRSVLSCSSKVKKSVKVGVFVDEEMGEIINIANSNTLKIIQLHGSETPEFCKELRREFCVIKAFGIDEYFDFEQLIQYQNSVDYFLFDTKTIDYGGSGKIFNWQLLSNYQLQIPFLLSGGITPNSAKDIVEFKHPSLAGIDLNSGFENKPGDKNIEMIKRFILELNNLFELKNRKNGEKK
jgi:phosphoribosylanthranilate isomerase